jgi:uncharacterized protein HemY
MEMQQIVQMLAKLQASQDIDSEERKAFQEKMAADLLRKMNEDREADQAKMEDFLARIGQETKDLLSHIDQSTQNPPHGTNRWNTKN